MFGEFYVIYQRSVRCGNRYSVGNCTYVVYLIDIIKVADLTEGEHHELELALIKLGKIKDLKSIKKKIKPFNGKVIKNDSSSCVLSVTGTSIDINNLIKSLKRNKIIETVRSGSIGLHESNKTLTI